MAFEKRPGLKWLREHAGYAGDDCLPWPFSANSAGYGTFMAFRQLRYAHRYMCEITHGAPATPKHHTRHSCDNTLCCNPRHLSWGTSSDNQLDRKARGRRRFKLTPEKVVAIRAAQGAETAAATALRFGVTEANIRQIQSGRTWRTGGYARGGFSVVPYRKGRPAKSRSMPSAERGGT